MLFNFDLDCAKTESRPSIRKYRHHAPLNNKRVESAIELTFNVTFNKLLFNFIDDLKWYIKVINRLRLENLSLN